MTQPDPPPAPRGAASIPAPRGAARVLSADGEADLAHLAALLRVWPTDDDPANRTTGLIRLCRERIGPQCVMVEVGSFAGVSTEIFALFARTVHAIDPFTAATAHGYREIDDRMLQEGEERFQAVLARRPNVTFHRQFSVIASFGFAPGSLDAVYVDGAHDEVSVWADVCAWRPRLKPGGLLMGHDHSSVAPFLGALGLHADQVYDEQSWVIQV